MTRWAPTALALAFALAIAPQGVWAQEGEGDEDDSGAPAAPVMTPPSLVSAPEVTLPEGAVPLERDASIVLVITVGVDGAVTEAQIETPVRDDVDELVLAATLQMRFTPATRDGEAIAARIRFRYTIDATAPSAPDPPESSGGDETDIEETDPGASEGGDDEPVLGIESVSEEDTRVLGVNARAQPVEAGAATRITLQAEELTTVPGTFGEPLRVVATLPGVVRSPFGLGFFLVRGANFQNTGFLVDGFPVPLLYHLGAGPAVISSRLVSRLNFYPGGYPANYGRFSAGLVSVETEPPPTDRVRGELEVDIFRASLLAVVPFEEGKGSVAGAFRRSYYEALLPLIQPGLELSFTDYQLRADYRPDRRLRVSLFGFGSDDILDQSGSIGGGVASAGTQTRVGYNFQRLIGTIDIRLPENVRMRIAGMIGRDGNFFESSNPGSDPLRIDIVNTYGGLRWDVQVPWTAEFQTNFGVDVNSVLFDVSAAAFVPPRLGEYPRPLFTPQTSVVDRTVVQALSAFYLDQIFRYEGLEISASGRFDYMRYGDISELFVDPRIVVRQRVTPELLIKGATGLFTQPPIAFQLTRDGGNPGLGPTRAWQTSGGAEVTFPERVELQLTGFYNQMFDITRQVNRVVNTPEGPEREFFVSDGEGRAYGLEVLLRRQVESGFYGWLSYTLSRSERLSGDRWVPFQFDQTHVLNLAASYAVDGWRFGIAFLLATGRPSSEVVGTTYDSDEDEYDPFFRDTGQRLPTFHRLDIRVDRDFDLGPIRGTVYLDIRNIYNAPNAEGVLYSFDYSQSATLPGIPILPTLGVRGVLQ